MKIGDQDRQLNEEAREFGANRGAIQYEANREAFGKGLSEQETEARTGLTEAQTGVIQQNIPMQEQAQKLHDEIADAWRNRTIPADQFEAWATEKLKAAPGPVGRMVAPHLPDIMQLPQTGKGYTLNMQDDLPVSVNVYGKDYDPSKPADAAELAKLPQGQQAIADFNRAQAVHAAKRGEKREDEAYVASKAAERQAITIAAQQQMADRKQVDPRISTALDADQRLSRMEASYQKAQHGDQQAMLALLSDHLGMTMGLQKGVRLNKDIIQEAQQSQPWLQKMAAKFDDRGYLSGVTLGPEQMKQMLDLGYEARDRAFQGAHDAATTYGQPLPKGFEQVEGRRTPGAKPVLEQGGGQGGGAHIIRLNGKRYQYNGSGDTADLKNYTEIK